ATRCSGQTPRRFTRWGARLRIARLAPILLPGLVFMAACAPADSSRPGPSESGQRPQIQRTLIMIENALSTDFASLRLGGSSTGVAFNIPATSFNAGLALNDERGRTSPFLAESCPQLDTDTCKLFPDAPMETTHRPKPNPTGHSAHPFTAQDSRLSSTFY